MNHCHCKAGPINLEVTHAFGSMNMPQGYNIIHCTDIFFMGDYTTNYYHIHVISNTVSLYQVMLKTEENQ